MPFRPSLTTEQLREIGRRRHEGRSADVVALLWEIALLQRVCRRADQFLACHGNSTVAQALRAELDELACIQEKKISAAEFQARLTEGRVGGKPRR